MLNITESISVKGGPNLHSDSPSPNYFEPPSSVHCPKCSACAIESPVDCDYCGAGYHADRETAGCSGQMPERLCTGETLHRLCTWHRKEAREYRRAREAGVE